MRGICDNKRGVSHHLEMVIAFVMFIMFVFFILIFVRPQDTTLLSSSVVSGVAFSYFDYSTTESVVFSFFVENVDVSTESCFRIDLPDELYSGQYSGSAMILGNGAVGSGISSSLVSVDSTVPGFYRGVLSDSLGSDSGLSGCVMLGGDDYEIGSFDTEYLLSVSRLEEMADWYVNDYSGFRSELGISDSFDFSVVSDVALMDREVPGGVDVFATTYLEKVLYADGTISYEEFTIKVWR
ncbi:MAG: hypothetical protein ACI83O_000108 [Patescibacteria group bacterium]|jgi:hypothetical protein